MEEYSDEQRKVYKMRRDFERGKTTIEEVELEAIEFECFNTFENYSDYWHAVFMSLRKRQVGDDEWRENYHDYLWSGAWRKKSQDAKQRANYRCQLCNKTDALYTHHRTYENIGNETSNDLTVLCYACHKNFHAQELHYEIAE